MIKFIDSEADEIGDKVESIKAKIKEADIYNQNQNVEMYQNQEFDYQILDITELDNVDSGDIRTIDIVNLIADLDESLTESWETLTILIS